MSSLKSFALPFLALVAGCALFTGCSTAPKVSGIGATLVGFRPMDNPDVPNRAIMTVRFTNESVNAAGFNRSTHKVYFHGLYVGHAENPSPIGLPAQNSTSSDLVLVIEDPALVRRSIGLSDQAVYRLESELEYTENTDLLRVNAHDEGKIALNGLEQAVR